MKLCLLVLYALCVLFSAADVNASPNMQVKVVVEDLNVRPKPPQFRLKTLFTMKYQVAPPIDVVKQGQLLDVTKKVSIGMGAEWLYVNYVEDSVAKGGWIYAGRTGNWVNVSVVDTGVYLESARNPVYAMDFLLIDRFIPLAHADQEAVSGSDLDGSQGNPLYVGFIALFNLLLFLGAMFAAKKIDPSRRFVMFTGVATLLISGVVTEAGFWGWMESVI